MSSLRSKILRSTLRKIKSHYTQINCPLPREVISNNRVRLSKSHHGLLPTTTTAIQSISQESPMEAVYHTQPANANTSKPNSPSSISHSNNNSPNSILQSSNMQEREEDKSNIPTQTTTTSNSSKTNNNSHQVSPQPSQEVSIRTSTVTTETCSSKRKMTTETLGISCQVGEVETQSITITSQDVLIISTNKTRAMTAAESLETSIVTTCMDHLQIERVEEATCHPKSVTVIVIMTTNITRV